MRENVGGIYQILNLIDKKIYIGSAINFLERAANHFSCLKNNKHFNQHLQNAYNKYGKENFVFEIIEFVEDFSILIDREDYYINLYNANNPQYGYNIKKFAGSSLGIYPTEETKKKISESLKGENSPNYGITLSDETKEKISNSLKGRKFSDEHKKKISEFAKTRKFSDETRKKISASNTGKHCSESTKAIVSKTHKGKIVSEETKQKMKENRADNSGENNYMFGKKHTEETRKKMSESKKKKKAIKLGITYEELVIREENEKILKEQSKLYGKRKNKYLGVNFVKSRNKWRASIYKDSQRYFLGYFNTEVEAALAYNAKSIELRGENAKLNIIEEEENE